MPVSPASVQHTHQTFGDISRFLREGVAQENSRQMRESLGDLSRHIDVATRLRRSAAHADAITSRVAGLAQSAKAHQLFLMEPGGAWHALYEFEAYQRTLRELIDAITAWHQALERRSVQERACFRQFELLAWRTLGEGLLLIDIHDQPLGPSAERAETAPRRLRAWHRLQSWLQRWLP